ncbi:MAG: hypothetical protein H8D43_03120 [Chloroflexi bacterium]|nr:hypothetical protein [Chloroflexota bacterium]
MALVVLAAVVVLASLADAEVYLRWLREGIETLFVRDFDLNQLKWF